MSRASGQGLRGWLCVPAFDEPCWAAMIVEAVEG